MHPSYIVRLLPAFQTWVKVIMTNQPPNSFPSEKEEISNHGPFTVEGVVFSPSAFHHGISALMMFVKRFLPKSVAKGEKRKRESVRGLFIDHFSNLLMDATPLKGLLFPNAASTVANAALKALLLVPPSLVDPTVINQLKLQAGDNKDAFVTSLRAIIQLNIEAKIHHTFN